MMNDIQPVNMQVAQNLIRTNLSSLRLSFSGAQKKKDSVQAVLIQLYPLEQVRNYNSLRVLVTNLPSLRGEVSRLPSLRGLVTNYPDNIELVSRLPNNIGLPDYIELVKYCQSSIGGWDLNLVNDVHSVDCLTLRFSDLSFFSQASITHDEKLELSRFTLESISSSNSCGNLIPLVVDLLFLYPVAIYRVSLNWCRNTIQEIFQFKILDVFIHLDIRCLCTSLCSGVKIATPRSARNTIEAFNQNVIRGNTMAMYKSTQIHPKFLWRFFSCQQSKYFSVEASNEKEARSLLPDSPCLFSARIRQEGDHA